jgi:type I restriction enzyme S subunit
MLRAGDIADGRIRPAELVCVGREVAEGHPKTRLRPGDLLIVLVGRIGEAAVTGPEHEGWNVARSVALVRCHDLGLAQWLRLWLAMPAARAWCETQAAGTVQRTLGLRSLRQLPVALPPLAERERAMHVVDAIESRIDVNDRIAHTAVALADAHFGVLTADRRNWPEKTFSEVVREVRTGTASRPSVHSEGCVWVTPADVLRSPFPHFDTTDTPDLSGAFGPVLVVPKAGQVHVAVTHAPVTTSRGVLALDPTEENDAWWLLHEVRSRGRELAQLAQGTAGRELSARTFGQAAVAWPPKEVLARFARIARTLHARALTAQRENRTLRTLLADTSPHPGGGRRIAPGYRTWAHLSVGRGTRQVRAHGD